MQCQRIMLRVVAGDSSLTFVPTPASVDKILTIALPGSCCFLFSCDCVTTVDAELGACHVQSRVGQEEGYGAHEVFWLAHFTLGDEGGPFCFEVWLVVEDRLGSGGCVNGG